MKSIFVLLNNSGKVRKFVDTLTNINGKYMLGDMVREIDARSILAIYCFDLSKPLLLKIEGAPDDIYEQLEEFMIQ